MKAGYWKTLAFIAMLAPASWAQAAITCSLSVVGVSTAYDPAAVTQTIVQSQFTVTCQRNLAADPTTQAYSVGVTNGGYFSAGTNRALLVSGGTNYYVKYDLYSSSACSSLWRDTPAAQRLPVGGGSMTLSGFVPTSVTTNYWACIPASQTGLAAGTYTDAVPATLYNGTANNSGVMDNKSIAVAIAVSSTCNITAAPGTITFNYTSFGAAVNPSTTFGATCTNGLPYTMALSPTNGTLLGLNYSLALSAASANGSGVQQSYTITGTMAAGQAGTCATGSCTASATHTLTISY